MPRRSQSHRVSSYSPYKYHAHVNSYLWAQELSASPTKYWALGVWFGYPGHTSMHRGKGHPCLIPEVTMFLLKTVFLFRLSWFMLQVYLALILKANCFKTVTKLGSKKLSTLKSPGWDKNFNGFSLFWVFWGGGKGLGFFCCLLPFSGGPLCFDSLSSMADRSKRTTSTHPLHCFWVLLKKALKKSNCP